MCARIWCVRPVPMPISSSVDSDPSSIQCGRGARLLDETFKPVQPAPDSLLEILCGVPQQLRLGSSFTKKKDGRHKHQHDIDEGRPIVTYLVLNILPREHLKDQWWL
jgi:hypothetical protein